MTEEATRAIGPDWPGHYRNAERLVNGLELLEIRTIRAEAELIDSAVADQIALDETVTSAQLQAARPQPDLLIFRTRHEDVYADAEGNDGARTLLEFAVVFGCPPEFEEPSQAEVEGFGAVTVMRIIQPYYREGVSSLLARIGLHGITVGLLRFPAAPPDVGVKHRNHG